MKNKVKQILYSVFPIFTIQFKEFWEIFKESWIERYITAWVTGLLIIGLLLIILITIGSFVFWTMPTFSLEPVEGGGAWFFRALFVAYSVFIMGMIEND